MNLFTHYKLIDQFKRGLKTGGSVFALFHYDLDQAGRTIFALYHHDLDKTIEHENAECIDTFNEYKLIKLNRSYWIISDLEWAGVCVCLKD